MRVGSGIENFNSASAPVLLRFRSVSAPLSIRYLLAILSQFYRLPFQWSSGKLLLSLGEIWYEYSIGKLSMRSLKPDEKDLLEVVDRRGIPYLLHYTPVKNLQSILKHGLLSRKQMEIREIKPVLYHGWGKKFKEMEDYICLSIVPPKGMIDRTKQSQVALAIRPSIITYSQTYFSPINSAKEEIDMEEIYSRETADDFEDLFQYDEGMKLRNDFAEILVKNYIEVKDILGIYFSGKHGQALFYYGLWVQSLFTSYPSVEINPKLF